MYNALPPSAMRNMVDEETGETQSSARTTVESISMIGLLWNLVINIVFLGFPALVSFFVVEPQEHVLAVFCGSLAWVYTTPGIKWFPKAGLTLVRIPVNVRSVVIPKTTCVDHNGNPIVVAAVVTYEVRDSLRAAFDVKDYQSYIESQALAVLKRVCSMYPYEAVDGKSLQRESDEVAREMIRILQSRADVAGIRVLTFQLVDLQYAPEIAAGMLVRQQALARIAARQTIVQGAVEISTHAVRSLEQSGVQMSAQEQARLVSNLLAVICGESAVQPVMSVSANY